MITGEITKIYSPPTPVGAPMQLLVNYNAFNDGWVPLPWSTTLFAEANGFKASNQDQHLMDEGHRDEEPEKLVLGVMPNHSVSGTLVLYDPNGKKTLDTSPFDIPLDRVSEVITRELPKPTTKYTDRGWWEFLSDPTVSAADPSTPTYEFPFETETPEEKKQTWLWVGLGIVAVVAVVFFLR